MKTPELYRIFWADNPDGSLVEDPDLEKDDLYFLPYDAPVSDWKTIHCSIIKGERFEDYQATSHCFRLCSQRLKDLFENNKGSDDKIQWLDAMVTFDGETRPYYVLHLYEAMDVVDYELSKWNPETTMFDGEPVFVREKIVNHNVFGIPMNDVLIVVKPFIVKEMKRQKMTGMAFGEAEVR